MHDQTLSNKQGKEQGHSVHNHLRSSPKQIVLLLYSLVKHNCHKHQEALSCSEFRVQNHKNKEIGAHNTCVTRDQMATSK